MHAKRLILAKLTGTHIASLKLQLFRKMNINKKREKWQVKRHKLLSYTR